MARDWNKPVAEAQANAWDPMVSSLATELGVSAESLRSLGVGYLPSVAFKKGPSPLGWWTFPMRDAEGKVTGMSLRSRRGAKYVVTGSRPGLAYPLNPKFVVGKERYRPGAHNWIRTLDAKVPCPVCGKPDGCLLDRRTVENPESVICIRESKGAQRETGMGWLHYLRSSANKANESPLPHSEYPVLVVEGASDAAVALTLGMVAVGRPSNTAGLAMLRELVRGRDVILLGENDKKPDGKWPGKDGVEAAFLTVKNVCASVLKAMPPEGVKDLRQWVSRTGVNAANVINHCVNHGEDVEDSSVLPDDSPLRIAERWVKEERSVDNVPTLRLFGGVWYAYQDGCYVEVDERAAIRGKLYEWLDGREFMRTAKDGGVEIDQIKPDRYLITEVIDALSRDCPLQETPPCWLDGRTSPDPKDLICYPNGVLDVEQYLRTGEPDLVPASPMLFTTNAAPYCFDAEASCPQWLEFLDSVLPDDPEKIDLLQEWFGYNLVPDMSHEKMMLCIGRSRSGKGTVLEVMRAVLGPQQVASTTFGSLCEKYGKAPLVGKLSAILPDARIPRRADSMVALETLLAIIGQDGVDIRRMALPTIPDHKLHCRFTAAVNELPDLPDHSQALEPRLLVLHFPESFIGREDRTLKIRLPKEAPGIALWALEGLRRLRANGQFTEPASTTKILGDFREVTSPLSEFLSECCVIDPDAYTDQHLLYNLWLGWGRERGVRTGTKSKFKQRLLTTEPRVSEKIIQTPVGRSLRFKGLRVVDWASQQYLGG